MVRTVSTEVAAKAAATVKSNQARTRGTAPVKAAPVKADKPKREALPAGQQRSRGRVILSAVLEVCNFSAKKPCGNPGRWPVANDKRLAKVAGVTAGTRTCTTHLRTILRAANLLDQQAAIEKSLVAGGQPKAPRVRAPKAMAQVLEAPTPEVVTA